MDETLSIYIITIKGSSSYSHGLGLAWKEKLFEGDLRRGREEVFSYAAFLVCVLSSCMKMDTKMAA